MESLKQIYRRGRVQISTNILKHSVIPNALETTACPAILMQSLGLGLGEAEEWQTNRMTRHL